MTPEDARVAECAADEEARADRRYAAWWLCEINHRRQAGRFNVPPATPVAYVGADGTLEWVLRFD